MGISSRIQSSIENWSELWKDRLKGWLVAILSFSMEVFFDILGKAASPKLTPLIKMLEATGKIPPELKPLLDEIKSPTGEVGAIFAQSAGSALIGGAVGKIIDAILLPLAYAVNSMTRNVEITEMQMIALWLRNEWTPEQLDEKLSWLGVPPDNVENLKKLTQIRIDPIIAVTAWRRGFITEEQLNRELKDQAWDDNRIKTLKLTLQEFPSLSDTVNFYAKEAFEPDMIAEYGLLDELPPYEGTLFQKLGVPKEIADLYWIAHWVHPAFREVTDMLHRGELTNKEVYQWYRVREIPPKWRDKLTAISWDLPNRIELRMMARYGLVDKAFLVEQLGMVGLREDYRSIAADMMLAMGVRTDLSTRYGKGWLTADQVKQELIDSGLSEEVRERMYQWIVKNTAGDRVTEETNLSKSEIYTGVKKGVITWSQGLELLQDHNLTLDEAQFILKIRVGALEGSPESYQEFKQITQLYRKSQGLDAKIPPEELVQAEIMVIEAEKALEQVRTKERTDLTESAAKGAVESSKMVYRQLLQKFEKRE